MIKFTIVIALAIAADCSWTQQHSAVLNGNRRLASESETCKSKCGGNHHWTSEAGCTCTSAAASGASAAGPDAASPGTEMIIGGVSFGIMLALVGYTYKREHKIIKSKLANNPANSNNLPPIPQDEAARRADLDIV